jgi:hypothetical protein
MTILVPTRGAEDWQRLLADPIKHWKRGYSAMAAALCWEAAKGLPPEVAAILGPDARLLLAIPEHKVALPGGRRESQCDVFGLVGLDAGLCALAVEAKVNETFGPTVGEWLQDASPGKAERLATICAMLGTPCPPPPELRYQLFHRTAAAIVEADRFGAGTAAMIVHSFSPDHRWFEDFAAFCHLLGAEPACGRGIEVGLPDGQRLILGWATGSPEFV